MIKENNKKSTRSINTTLGDLVEIIVSSSVESGFSYEYSCSIASKSLEKILNSTQQLTQNQKLELKQI